MSLSVRSALVAALVVGPLHGQSVQPKGISVAEGVHLFVTPPYSDVGLDGNSVVIVGDDGVLVFDSNGTPAAAMAVLAEIRKLTPLPVKYLVSSHWHWDHWYGAQVYREAFPGIAIITHERSREMMRGPAIAFNQPGLDRDLPGHIRGVEQELANAKADAARAGDVERLEKHLRDDRFFLEQKRSVTHTVGNLTYGDSLTIHLGSREIRVVNQGPAVTPGDSYLYLPNDSLVVTGDLLVNPISFALSVYPTGWLRTLETIARRNPKILVPGHGEPLRDHALLGAHIELFRTLIDRGGKAKRRGLDVEAAKLEIAASLADLRRRFTNGDSRLDAQFDLYLVDWFLHRVYDELDGPLGEAIVVPRH